MGRFRPTLCVIIVITGGVSLHISEIWSMVWPVLVAVISFLFLILIHELGHFIAAKAVGVRVNEFAIGFGPKILKFQGKSTLYSVRLLPLGGFCAMEGEDEDSDDPNAFNHKKPWQRFIITAAGATVNLLFGFVLILLLLAPADRYAGTTVADFKEDAISCNYGLQAGDTILSVNGRSIATTNDLSYTFTNIDADGKIDMTVRRDGEKVKLKDVRFQTQVVDDMTMITVDFYVQPIEKTVFSYITQALKTTFSYAKLVWWSLVDLVTGKYGISAVSGPVGITVVLADTVKRSFRDLAGLLALLTVNLGLFNLFPLPALDGGRLLFLLIEMLRRKPVPQKYEGLVHGIGLAILLAISGLILIKDIISLF